MGLECDRDQAAILATFRQLWGYDRFRPPQGEIVQALLAGQDVLVVMPTGGGKSVCFQLPALMQSGVTLVISPLVALMENQVAELQQRQLPAAVLHSELPRSQRQQTLQALARQQLRLLYLSPETLLSPTVWQQLCQPQIQINGLILDEAHCLVQWGDRFRPAYRRLGAVRPALLRHRPAGTRIAIAAFTATADPNTQQTIQTVLQLQQPHHVQLSPYRPNLRLQVQTVWTPRGRWQRLLQFLAARPSESGLIYVRTRRSSEELASRLQQQGYRVAAYHAGLSPQQRRRVEADWLQDRLQAVTCTSAFGMGINKPNVRWVVQFQAPQLLSEYIQEVGRAGRDGDWATALTLVSEPTGWLDPTDRQQQQFFQNQARSQYKTAQQLSQRLPAQGEIEAVTRQFPDSAAALALLHCQDQLTWETPFRYQLRRPSNRSPARTTSVPSLQAMHQYLHSRPCRWQTLLQQFGFIDDAQRPCQHCDNCDRYSSRVKANALH